MSPAEYLSRMIYLALVNGEPADGWFVYDELAVQVDAGAVTTTLHLYVRGRYRGSLVHQ